MTTNQSDGDSDSREMGVEFGNLREELSTEEYPIGREALLEEYGESEIETESGSQSLQSILGGQEEETGTHEYESADAVEQSVLNMVGSGAVGREEYSDRGGSVPDDVEESDHEDEETL